MKLSPTLILTLVLVGAVLLLLGWQVSEKEQLSEKLQELQNPSTELKFSEPHPPAPAAKSSVESSAKSAIEEESLEKLTPQERLKSRRLLGYVDYIKKRHQSILPKPEFSENFEPNEELAILFDLSPNQMETLRTRGSKTMEQIRAWEVERTEEVSQNADETMLICSIPAADKKVLQIKDEFLAGVRETIGGDSFSIVEHSLERCFFSLQLEREVSISLFKDENGKNWYTLEELGTDERRGIRSENKSEGPFSDDGKSVPKRYAHLFAIDTE